MFRALTSPYVFACSCRLLERAIAIDILCFSEDAEPGEHTLYAESGESFRVRVPESLANPAYKVELLLL